MYQNKRLTDKEYLPIDLELECGKMNCTMLTPLLYVRRFLLRFRYPVSLPEDIACALGITIPQYLPFKQWILQLNQSPTKLTRFMPRELAENAFQNAVRTERFCEKTLVSYYFNEGWLEFVLHFDRDARLRRIYIVHREFPVDVELPLSS